MINKIVIYPYGGLANRMNAIAASVSFANDKQLPFSIVWSLDKGLNARFDDIFAIPQEFTGDIRNISFFKAAFLYVKPCIKNAFISSLTLKRFGCVWDQDEKMPLDLNGDGVALVRGFGSFYPYTFQLYRSLFKLTPQLRERVNVIKEKLGPNSVGVHIRRTDNIESIAKSPDELFINAMQEYIDNDSSVRFYLATDDLPTKQKFKELFGDRIISGNEVVRRDTLDGIMDAAVELYALASTNAILGSHHSTFSMAAAALGDIPLRQLIRCDE